MKAARITAHLAGAGLFAGATAWALHQQTEYVIAAMVCNSGAILPMWTISAAALLILVTGAILSWLAIRSFAAEKQIEAHDRFRARRFLASVAMMGALLFLFALVLQIAAVLYLPVCTG
jgi:cytochrome b subunit of formate dehydrogenase